jgi:lysine-N-methylase
MQRFQCLGGDCEDTCCKHWTVKIDQSHYVKLKRALKGPEDRPLFERAFVLRDPPDRTPDAFARILMDPETDHCPYLSPTKMCGLHMRFGESLLADVCAVYPRYLSQIGDRYELTGSTSCPEAARGALLHEDGLELVETDSSLAGRTAVTQRPLDQDAPFIDELRGTMLMLLDRAAYPLASRVYFILYLVHESSPFISGDTRDFERLSALTESMLTPQSLDALHVQFSRGPQHTGRGWLALIHQIARLRRSVRDTFRFEMDRVVDSYAQEGALVRSDETVRMTELFPSAYLRRRGSLAPALADHAEMVMRNWVKLFCLRELYPRRSTPRIWALELALRLATHRFLLFSEPVALAERAAFDQRLITIVYQIARVVDHNETVLSELLEDMSAQLPGLDAMAELLLI